MYVYYMPVCKKDVNIYDILCRFYPSLARSLSLSPRSKQKTRFANQPPGFNFSLTTKILRPPYYVRTHIPVSL